MNRTIKNNQKQRLPVTWQGESLFHFVQRLAAKACASAPGEHEAVQKRPSLSTNGFESNDTFTVFLFHPFLEGEGRFIQA